MRVAPSPNPGTARCHRTRLKSVLAHPVDRNLLEEERFYQGNEESRRGMGLDWELIMRWPSIRFMMAFHLPH